MAERQTAAMRRVPGDERARKFAYKRTCAAALEYFEVIRELKELFGTQLKDLLRTERDKTADKPKSERLGKHTFRIHKKTKGKGKGKAFRAGRVPRVRPLGS